jgi:predicted enzyme related to lactoylglutathione lyase
MATNRQLNAKLVICHVPTNNSANAQKFYNTLFGGDDFARSLNDKIESYYRLIHQDGLTLTIATRQDQREPVTCYFAVDNLDDTVRQLVAAGGKVVVNSTPLPPSGPPQAIAAAQQLAAAQHVQPSNIMGRFVTMLDPDENYIGLIQLDASVQSKFNAQPAQRMLSQQQVTDHDNWKQHGERLMPHP